MKIGNLVKGGALVKAELDWNSGNRDKQLSALSTWSKLGATGNVEAIEKLQELTNAGVEEASKHLSQAFTALAVQALKKRDQELAVALADFSNNGWNEASAAMDVAMGISKLRVAFGGKPKEKTVDKIRFFADAGYSGAIQFLKDNDLS